MTSSGEVYDAAADHVAGTPVQLPDLASLGMHSTAEEHALCGASSDGPASDCSDSSAVPTVLAAQVQCAPTYGARKMPKTC